MVLLVRKATTTLMELIKTFPKGLVLKFRLLCLDFTNTVFWRLHEEPIEGFTDYSILIKWGWNIGLLHESDSASLIQEAQKYPREAIIVLRQAIKPREALFRIIVATTKGSHPDTSDRDHIQPNSGEGPPLPR